MEIENPQSTRVDIYISMNEESFIFSRKERTSLSSKQMTAEEEAERRERDNETGSRKNRESDSELMKVASSEMGK